MSAKRPIFKRYRTKFGDASVRITFYKDGGARIFINDPSNDPAIEIGICGLVAGVVAKAYLTAGLPVPDIGPVRWRSDPKP